MKNYSVKFVALLIAVIMVLTCMPIGELSHLFSLKAEAASVSVLNGNKVGTISTYTVEQIYDRETDSYSYNVTDVVFNGNEYPVSESFDMSVEEVEGLVGQTIIAHIYSGAITGFQLVSDQKSRLLAEFDPVEFSYSYNNNWFDRKKMSIVGCLKNKIVNSAWHQADVTEVEEYMSLMGYNAYNDVTIEFRSTDSDKLYFMDGLLKTASLKLDVSKCISVGNEFELSADIYVNTEYCPEDGADIIPIEYTVYSGTDIEVHDEFDVTIKNTDYVPTPEFESVSLDELLVILYEKIDEYHPKFLKSKQPLISLFTATILNDSITEMKGLYDSFDNLKVAIDVNNMVCQANIGGLVVTASDAYLEKLFDSIEDEAKTIAGYTDSAIEKLITSDDFQDYIEWYQVNYGYINGYYKGVGVHCPTNVVVTDEDGNTVLTITDEAIQVYDDLIYAFVYENEKIFYLPTNIDYNIEISATDDGTMDYTISTITPGGMERVVTYDDVKLEKDEVYTSLVTSEIFQPIDTYNLVLGSGKIIEADSDTLPPVSSDVTDVVVAEDLFANFSEEAINAVSDAMFSMKSSVSLTDYQIALKDSVALFSAVSKYYPVEYSLMVNGDFSYRIVYNTANNCITEIRFDYGETADLSDYQAKVTAVKTEIDALVKVIEDMSDFEKALYIHDYIVLNCQYDTELLEVLETNGELSGELVSERYTEHSVLVNGTGICGSYALAYRAVLNAAGVDCIYISSAEMNHAWNMVKLDGQWYHVDCCWDDPVPDSEGRARRTYFLRTDKEMMDLSHYSWSPCQYKATSEKYSEMPRNYDYVQKYDYKTDCWYYLLGRTIYKADKYGNEKTPFAENVIADSIDCNNGSLFYAEDLFVYGYSDTAKKWEPVYYVSQYDAGNDPNEAYIVNFFIDDNNISYYKYTDEFYYNSEEDNGTISTVTYVKDELKKELFESITGIELDYTELEMSLFDYGNIYATILSDYEVWDLDVEYSSSDENIVSVDEYGTLKALNAGEAVITASFLEYSATCIVKVKSSDSNKGSCGNNIIWTYDAQTGKLTLSGSGAMTNYTSTNTPWHSFIAEVKSVEISNGITSIGNYAFYKGINITSVSIPQTVTSIGRYSFYCCERLEKLDIPAKVTSIGDSAFGFCYALSDIEIPSGVTSLGSFVFYYCENLKSVEIPSAITKIQTYMFCGCESLEKITLGSNIKSIGDYAFMYCSSLASVYIPSSVTSISRYAFANCTALTDVTLSEGLIYLSDYVFEKCSSLESITLPESISELYGGTFKDCTSLKDVKLPSTLKTIDYAEFQNCTSLEIITIPATVTSIYYNSFSDCFNLKEINVNEDNQYYSSVDGVLFNKDKTTLIQVPADKDNSSYSVPQSVTVIKDYAFQYCGNLKSITIPESVTDIGSLAFSHCINLENINIPSNITSIKSGMFQCCESLKSLTIPVSITEIKDFAFNGCDSLAHVGYGCTESEFSNIKIDKTANSALLNAPYIHYDFDPESDVVVMDEKAPTCTQQGNTAGVYCKDCQLFLSGESIPVKAHNYEVTDSFEGSCTEKPYDVRTCSDCKDSYIAYGKSSYGHKYVTTVVKATCTQPGYTLEVCSVCNESTTVDFSLPIGHRLVIVKPSDYCENHGTYQYCCINKDCDYSEHITIDASEIETETVITEASCTESGIKKEVCSLCDATISTVISAPTGHTFSEEWTVDKEATATESGSKSRHCINCDVKTDITEIIYEGCLHTTTTIINATEATCETDGYTGDVVCECGESIETGTVIPATGHTEVIDKGYDATDYEDGLTDGKHCSVCNKVLVEQEIIPAKGQGLSEPTEDNSIETVPPTEVTDSTEVSTETTDSTEVPTEAPSNTDEEIESIIGDVNFDGEVNILDVTTIQRYLAQFMTFDDKALTVADTNDDGNVNILDATHIQRFLAELIDSLR